MKLNTGLGKIQLNLDNAKVLIVDDQPLSLIVLKKRLSEHFSVSTASSGEDALLQVKNDIPDIILLDISMDGMSGIQTCIEFKNNELTHEIPIIFVTSLQHEETQCWDAGAVDFVTKPINPETLYQRVRSHLTIKFQHDILLKQVFLDGLTNVFNRRYFDSHFEKVELHALREKTDYAVLLIDIDYFKQFNDIYGHLQGDNALIRVAKTITDSLLRPQDFVARYGGEEFVVVLPNTSSEGAKYVAEKIKCNIESLAIEHQFSEHDYLTISIGGATFKSFNDNQQTIEIADKLLYKAKSEGRNRIHF
ncbi:diguanylate cyclase [Pseudoalteromonas sp. MMG010]|uniref:diguanylate cyclase n=1 Tax=Pseudoalteromonas sp. MMG010 TaxID=2822685 RepID=UPI001B3A63F0|nr:diguanylate cyclase [Pseudoalteromonas sp. MMG010]MBQ4833281.1 diguanylate cyclase [Pseudoalteromonas sp. MMG010]